MSAAVVETDGQLFTRGGPGVPDNRGQSMVEKHVEKLQKEKEAKAMEKLKVLMPTVGSAVLSLALADCAYDVDRAVIMLRRFQVAKVKELRELEKERKKYELEKAKRQREQESSDEGASSGQSDSGGSESESGSEGERQRRRSKDKKRKRSSSSRSPRRSSKRRSDKEKKKKERESSKRRKERRDRKARAKDTAPQGAAVRQEEYGKYGIIRETDMYAKRPEFMLWAQEIKRMDLEILPKFEEKELFKEFMEEYNTATLPHKKYYDLDLYERRRAIKATKKGLPAGPVERTAFDDEMELKRERAAQRAKEQQERLEQAYEDLLTSNKAEDMREQQLLRMKMGLAYRTGDVEEARKIAEKLKPDDPADVAARPAAPRITIK